MNELQYLNPICIHYVLLCQASLRQSIRVVKKIHRCSKIMQTSLLFALSHCVDNFPSTANVIYMYIYITLIQDCMASPFDLMTLLLIKISPKKNS